MSRAEHSMSIGTDKPTTRTVVGEPTSHTAVAKKILESRSSPKSSSLTPTSAFIFAGRAIFTVFADADPSRCCTYRIRHKRPNYYFLSLENNTGEWTEWRYIGTVDRGMGLIRLTAKSAFRIDDEPVVVAQMALDAVIGNGGLPEGWRIERAKRCGRCGRELTTPESLERGFGPSCWLAMGTIR